MQKSASPYPILTESCHHFKELETGQERSARNSAANATDQKLLARTVQTLYRAEAKKTRATIEVHHFVFSEVPLTLGG